MELKGSKTEANLWKAFAGESMARNKYLFFADKARQEGHEDVAALFERMAQNEGVHGKLLYQMLAGVGTTAENLQEAISGEYQEWTRLYPGFAQTAREEGLALPEGWVWADRDALAREYAVPNAFQAFSEYVKGKLGYFS